MKWLLTLFGVFLWMGTAFSVELNICTDQNNWFPFTFTESQKSAGVHVDMVEEACRQLGWQCRFTPLPWKRCLQNASKGEYDAVVSASYNSERAGFLHYPPDAGNVPVSAWRLSQVQYVVTTHVEDPYRFEGDVQDLPHPVRAPLGYSIVKDLMDQGVAVETGIDSESDIRSLITTKRGSVINGPETVQAVATRFSAKDQVRIHPKSLASKSYFVTFSRESTPVEEQRSEFWHRVRQIRENGPFMQGLEKKYGCALAH